VLNVLGIKAWECGFHSRRQCKEMMEISEKAKQASGHVKRQHRTFLRWFQRCFKFWEPPDDTRERQRRTKWNKGGITRNETSFLPEDVSCLAKTVKAEPQLQTCETQERMLQQTGNIVACVMLQFFVQNSNQNKRASHVSKNGF
jgi:hypothetical protein